MEIKKFLVKNRINIFFISICMILFFSSISILSYLDIKNTEYTFNRIKDIQKEIEWIYVKIIACENYESLHVFIENISLNIRKEIITYYDNNIISLKNDLNNLGNKFLSSEKPNPILNILSKNIEGKYFKDINNDNNDIFILTKDDGIVSNFSLNTLEKFPKSIEQEIQLHAQPNLAKQAFKRIINQELIVINGISQNPIGWSYLKPYKENYCLDKFSWNNLETLYKENGLIALASYEFLYPFYLDYYQDLAKVKNISEKGIKNYNKQIIVIGSYNLYDVISTKSNYLLTLEKFKKENKYINEIYRSNLFFKKIVYLITVILFLFILISCSIIYNKDITFFKKNK